MAHAVLMSILLGVASFKNVSVTSPFSFIMCMLLLSMSFLSFLSLEVELTWIYRFDLSEAIKFGMKLSGITLSNLPFSSYSDRRLEKLSVSSRRLLASSVSKLPILMYSWGRCLDCLSLINISLAWKI